MPLGVGQRGDDHAGHKSTHKADPLKDAYKRLLAEYPSSEWTKRAKPYNLL